jgi:hypothetical protein
MKGYAGDENENTDHHNSEKCDVLLLRHSEARLPALTRVF